MTAGALASVAFCANGFAQTSDALLNKLVQKGVLTVKEANELQEETKNDAAKKLEKQKAMADWVTDFKFGGDFRGRFEQNNAENEAYTDRNRFRYRLRVGAVASLLDNFDIGLRLASGDAQTNPGGTLVGGKPITANQTLGSLESRKFIWIDAAYAKWTPIKNEEWTVSSTIGKMDNPFQFSRMVWDYDINPEGAALQVKYDLTKEQSLRMIGGFFVLDEIDQGVGTVPSIGASHDPYLAGGQILWDAKWTPKFDTSLGIAAFNVGERESLSSKAQPFYNSGNTRDDATGILKYNYNPIIATASAGYKFDGFPLYPGPFPVRLLGEYMYNPGAPDKNVGWNAGVGIGKAGKKRAWELNYRYQRLEADAWFDALVDDDNGAYYAAGNPQLVGTGKASGWFGGTNVKGHLASFTYSFTDYMNFTFVYYVNDLITKAPGEESSAGHFYADLNWRF